jgi:A/G-specific adenine glycosylase
MPAPSARTHFAQRLIAWQRQQGRHDLPWQDSRDAYRVWLSEIMLQQTQVTTVIPYYLRFLDRFPDLAALATAPVEAVMALWGGLGYYARARNLHACARLVMAEYGGAFPHDPESIARLPGIGRSTANAIAVFCFGASRPILDGNVKRLLCRHEGIEGFPGTAAVERRLWDLAGSLLPVGDIDIYIQAQMDLGATLCTRHRPRCAACPVAEDCVARRDGRTAALPTARPRRDRPEREVTVLLLVHEGRTLLEPRPPTGIWGGLLSLPELPSAVGPAEHVARLGCRLLSERALPPVTHGFTHFVLRLKPLLCRVAPLVRAAEPAGRWLAPHELATAGLPAPIRRLLLSQSAPGQEGT